MTAPDFSALETIPKEQLDAALDAQPLDNVLAIALWGRGQLAREDNFESFKHYYWCIHGRELPEFQYTWYHKTQAKWEEARKGRITGVLNEAARGLGKSTFNNTFVSQKMGLYPLLSHLIVQARDKDSKKTSEFFADLISKSEGWKACFPNVIPDIERGWNLDGYHIKDKSVDYSKFIKQAMSDHGRDPSFMAVSVTGGSIGSHPTGCLVLDDICDENNTSSDVESAKIVKKVQAEILPTMSRKGAKPLLIGAFTPWTTTDTYSFLKQTGSFEHIFTPAFVYDENGLEDWFGQAITLSWPDGKTVEELKQWKQILSWREFRRQLLLDLTVDTTEEIYYPVYPEDMIDLSWPMGGGVDPSNTESDNKSDLRKQSHFAMCYGAKPPTGGVVVVDGVLEQCSIDRGIQHITNAQSIFPRWKDTVVEFVGYGRMWFQIAQRTPGLKIRSGNLKGFGFTDRHAANMEGKSRKANRLYQEMFPLFSDGIVKISSKRTPYLDALRKLFQEFYTIDPNDPAWDAGDACYQMLKGMMDALRVRAPENDILPGRQERKPEHPLAALMRM